MKTYAIVLNGVVIQVVHWEYKAPSGLPKEGSVALLAPYGVKVGDLYDSETQQFQSL